jgi:hypothetical protein
MRLHTTGLAGARGSCGAAAQQGGARPIHGVVVARPHVAAQRVVGGRAAQRQARTRVTSPDAPAEPISVEFTEEDQYTVGSSSDLSQGARLTSSRHPCGASRARWRVPWRDRASRSGQSRRHGNCWGRRHRRHGNLLGRRAGQGARLGAPRPLGHAAGCRSSTPANAGIQGTLLCVRTPGALRPGVGIGRAWARPAPSPAATMSSPTRPWGPRGRHPLVPTRGCMAPVGAASWGSPTTPARARTQFPCCRSSTFAVCASPAC